MIEHNGISLNPPSGTTALPAQMSDNWVEYVALKLNDAGKTDVGNMILLNKNKITKYVSAVDKTQGEINFVKLGSYVCTRASTSIVFSYSWQARVSRTGLALCGGYFVRRS